MLTVLNLQSKTFFRTQHSHQIKNHCCTIKFSSKKSTNIIDLFSTKKAKQRKKNKNLKTTVTNYFF